MFKKDMVAKAFQTNQRVETIIRIWESVVSLPGWTANAPIWMSQKASTDAILVFLSWMIQNIARFSRCFIPWGVECTHITIAWASGCFPWKPRKQNLRCWWKCVISSSCSLTPLIFLTHLARGVPLFLRPPRASHAAGDAQNCTQHFLWAWLCNSEGCRAYWITCFKCSDSRCFFKKKNTGVDCSGSIRHKRVSSFFFLKRGCVLVTSPKHYNWSAWGCVYVLSDNVISYFQERKAEYAPRTMTALVSSWGRACGSFPAFGKANTQCCISKYGMCCEAGGSFSTMSYPSGWRQQGQDRKWQVLRKDKAFPGPSLALWNYKLAHPETASDSSFLGDSQKWMVSGETRGMLSEKIATGLVILGLHPWSVIYFEVILPRFCSEVSLSGNLSVVGTVMEAC